MHRRQFLAASLASSALAATRTAQAQAAAARGGSSTRSGGIRCRAKWRPRRRPA